MALTQYTCFFMFMTLCSLLPLLLFFIE
uniref:Uncharacterized protein n=1 Tax=Arundo donax TaxID=35708 RepID=A0A0A8YW24_ARUDO